MFNYLLYDTYMYSCTIIIVNWAISDGKKMNIKHRYTYPYKIMVLTPTNKTLCVASLVIIDSYVHTNLHSYIIFEIPRPFKG